MANEVPPHTPAAAIIEDEERLYARVQARVALGVGDGGARVGAEDYDRELISLRDAIGEAKPEDLAPLVEQMTRLAAIRRRLGGSRTLPVDVQSPYFAHMVLRDDGRCRDVLVGKRGFIDRKSNIQIVDWRNAPVSQIYYRYDEGDDYDEEIAGRRLAGILEVRRNISIAGGRLRRIGAPQGTFIRDARNVWHEAVGQAAPVLQGGQGKAARVPAAAVPARPAPRSRRRARLGVHHGALHRADKHLPEIAALIDREQFDLITQPESGLVVIQGGAGSGKTTVALHRIAYLNFADPKRFRPGKILFVVPSEALVRYVAGVLPSLGVDKVPVVTYAAWAKSMRLRMLRGTSGKYNFDAPDAAKRVKKHPAMLSVLEEAVAGEVRAARDALTAAVPGPEGRALLAEWDRLSAEVLLDRLRKLESWLRRGGAGMAASVRHRAESALKRLRRRAGDIVSQWAEILTDEGRLRAGFACVGADDVSTGDIASTVKWVAAQQARDPSDEPVGVDGAPVGAVDGRPIDEDDPAGRFDPEDDPLLLRLVQLIRGGLVSGDGGAVEYEHVAIDEAQDRSAVEIKVLLDATARAPRDPAERSVTIAGDTAQRLVFDNSFDSWDRLLADLGHRGVVVRPLHLSYRSTAEVMELARDILGPKLAPDEPLVARSGAPVELHCFGDIGEVVAFLGDALRGLASREPTASVAVIARYPEQADAYYAGLTRAEVPSLRRVRRQNFSFAAGVDVTEASQVKGLEFDYVIMVDVTAASYPDTLEARHLLHIGMTRAAHQLWLMATGAPSPLLPARLRSADA